MARILIIEDNPANVELMAFLLTAHGHAAASAPDGPRGIAAARAAPPELVACDVHLPGMDGFSVLAALKAEPALAGVPVLAVTALAMAGAVLAVKSQLVLHHGVTFEYVPVLLGVVWYIW